jgi:hypothetical protein
MAGVNTSSTPYGRAIIIQSSNIGSIEIESEDEGVYFVSKMKLA